jgi:endonuclease/exonuclease/phosphatase family metal-dependent hydrolase
VRIDLPGGRVANFWPMLEGERCWVGCTHFYPFPQAELVEMRSESARRVLAWWSEQPSNDRMLLMGDYNSLPDDPAVDLFLAAGFRDAIPPGVDGRPSRAATAHEFLEEGGWRLDYLFHSPGWKVLHADILHPKPAPSDHHPLFAEIKPQAGSD